MPTITYAICVCTEHREIECLINFLLKTKRSCDTINVLIDTKHVTPKVTHALLPFRDRTDCEFYERDFDDDFGQGDILAVSLDGILEYRGSDSTYFEDFFGFVHHVPLIPDRLDLPISTIVLGDRSI